LDELAGMTGTESSVRMAQFLSLRQTIEQTASRLFDQARFRPGSVVRIFRSTCASSRPRAQSLQWIDASSTDRVSTCRRRWTSSFVYSHLADSALSTTSRLAMERI
jgi:hypothetical protein